MHNKHSIQKKERKAYNGISSKLQKASARLLAFIVFGILIVSCSDKPKWHTTTGGQQFYGIANESKYTYSWDGDSTLNLINGKGHWIVKDKDGNVVSDNVRKAIYGTFPKENKYKSISNGWYLGEVDRNGQPDGSGVLIQDSVLKVGNFNNGELDGKNIIIGCNGHLLFKGEMKDGYACGNSCAYDKDGNLLYKGEYKDGRYNGKGTSYYPDGQIRYEGKWSDGQYNGVGTFHYEKSDSTANHVWEDGSVPESTIEMYQYLEQKRTAIGEENYQSLVEHFFSYEKHKFWMYFGLYFILFLPFLVTFVVYANSKERIQKLIEPQQTKHSYKLWLYGGLGGLHRAYLGSRMSLVQSLLFLCFIAIQGKSIILYLGHPSVWSEMFELNTFSIILLVVIIVWLIFDLVWMRYQVYYINTAYFRKDTYELDILNGRQTEIELFYSTFSKDLKENDEKLQDGLDKARAIMKEKYSGGSTIGWIKAACGNDPEVNFESKRCDRLMEIFDSTYNIVQNYQERSETLLHYLEDARRAAYRNIFLAKELITLTRSIKGKKQELQTDEIYTITADFSIENLDVQIDYNNQTKMINNSISVISGAIGKGNFKKAGIVAGISIIEMAMNNLENNEKLKLAYTKRSAQMVSKMSAAVYRVIKSEATLLHASEILSSLFVANKAFVLAYTQLRDETFGDASIRNFIKNWRYGDTFVENNENLASLQHLKQVCTEYNKINSATIN